MNTHVDQVGGNHYQAPYQHWDWVAETGLGYLEGCASKYVYRWQAKAGAEDLKKALSFINKAMVTEVVPAGNRPGRSPHLLAKFLHATGIVGTTEALVITLIDTWRTREELEEARAIIQDMIHYATR